MSDKQMAGELSDEDKLLYWISRSTIDYRYWQRIKDDPLLEGMEEVGAAIASLERLAGCLSSKLDEKVGVGNELHSKSK